MQQAFKALTDLALDPFACLAAARDPREALRAAGLGTDELELALASDLPDREAAANGSFASCETCIDPGDDPDPFP